MSEWRSARSSWEEHRCMKAATAYIRELEDREIEAYAREVERGERWERTLQLELDKWKRFADAEREELLERWTEPEGWSE